MEEDRDEPPVPAGPRLDVLLLDHDAARAEALRRGLEAAGLTVAARRTQLDEPQEVEAAIHELRPATLVLDIPEPRSEGWELYRALRERGAVVDLPVILTSREKEAVETAHGISALALGADLELEVPRIAAEVRAALGEEAEVEIEEAPGPP